MGDCYGVYFRYFLNFDPHMMPVSNVYENIVPIYVTTLNNSTVRVNACVRKCYTLDKCVYESYESHSHNISRWYSVVDTVQHLFPRFPSTLRFC